MGLRKRLLLTASKGLRRKQMMKAGVRKSSKRRKVVATVKAGLEVQERNGLVLVQDGGRGLGGHVPDEGQGPAPVEDRGHVLVGGHGHQEDRI